MGELGAQLVEGVRLPGRHAARRQGDPALLDRDVVEREPGVAEQQQAGDGQRHARAADQEDGGHQDDDGVVGHPLPEAEVAGLDAEAELERERRRDRDDGGEPDQGGPAGGRGAEERARHRNRSDRKPSTISAPKAEVTRVSRRSMKSRIGGP